MNIKGIDIKVIKEKPLKTYGKHYQIFYNNLIQLTIYLVHCTI